MCGCMRVRLVYARCADAIAIGLTHPQRHAQAHEQAHLSYIHICIYVRTPHILAHEMLGCCAVATTFHQCFFCTCMYGMRLCVCIYIPATTSGNGLHAHSWMLSQYRGHEPLF